MGILQYTMVSMKIIIYLEMRKRLCPGVPRVPLYPGFPYPKWKIEKNVQDIKVTKPVTFPTQDILQMDFLVDQTIIFQTAYLAESGLYILYFWSNNPKQWPRSKNDINKQQN